MDLRQLTPDALCMYTNHPVLTLWEFIGAQLPLFPELRPRPIPVLGLPLSPKYEEAVHTLRGRVKHGLCLRLTAEDAQRSSVWSDIHAFVNRMHCHPSNVHLLVDYRYITPATLPNLFELSSRLPYIEEWKTFTVAAGSFPIDLTKLQPDSESELERLEWKLWVEHVRAARHLARYPSFADYGIYYPYNTEHERPPTPSASIRYASTDYWVVMRGRKICKKNGGCQQYPRHAVALRERDEYRGSDFCAGDARIEQVAKAHLTAPGSVRNPGGVREWLTIGFNHHVTLTAREVASVRARTTKAELAATAA